MTCYNTPKYKRLQWLLYRPCSYAANATKQHIELCSGFFFDYARSTARNTRPTQAAIIPPAPRWSTSQRRNISSTYQIPAPRRTLYRSTQPSIIIMYIRVQRCACYGSMPDGATHRRPCRPGGVSVSTCTGSARHPPPGGRRGTIDGYRRSSFRAFAR